MCENALFFFSRAGSGQNKGIVEAIMRRVSNEKMVEKGMLRDHVMLMSISNSFKLDLPELWNQIEAIFTNTFLKQQTLGIPSGQVNEIVSIYTFEFARAGKGKEIWEEFAKFMRGRAESR